MPFFNRLDKNFFDYIKLNNSVFTDWQAMQTYTCFAILAGLHRPKCLLRDPPPSPQDRPHSVTTARPADAEKFSEAKENLYTNGSSIHIEVSYFPFTWHRLVFS